MKIILPKREWFTVLELAIEWRVSIESIQHLLDTGKLKMSFRVKTYKGEYKWRDNTPCRLGLGYEDELIGEFILLEEVERFEKEHHQEQKADRVDALDIQTPQETDDVFAKRLKEQGLSDKEIAIKLKMRFPAMTDHRIGVLLTSVPGRIVTPETYTKRGFRLRHS